MTRKSSFSNPLLLGFEMLEQTHERITRSGDGYPPYNIECLSEVAGSQGLRITLAVAGFEMDELEVTVENSQLIIRGKHIDDSSRKYLYRGIAARQFQRVFALADGMQVVRATLKNGLLSVDLDRPVPDRQVKRIVIAAGDSC